MSIYNNEFYQNQRGRSKKSAETIVPIILDFIKPESVVDVGCGVGTWLCVFKKHGIKDILGVDGNYVDRRLLEVSEGNFIAHDLEKPIEIKRKFDLVISLEVAEHITNKNADIFVESLINLGDVIVFSAAIPNQDGKNHVNERWPEFWIELFKKRGYLVVDCIRDKIWNDNRVSYYYAQNMLIFLKKTNKKKYELIDKKRSGSQMSIVHPKLYLKKCKDIDIYRESNLYYKNLLYKLLNEKIDKIIDTNNITDAAIFGSKKFGKIILKKLKNKNINIISFLDNNAKKEKKHILGVPVYRPDWLVNNIDRIDSIFISIEGKHYKKIIEQLSNLIGENKNNINIFSIEDYIL